MEGLLSTGPTLSSLQATMVLNVINEINIKKLKNANQQACYNYRFRVVNIFSVTCVRKK